MLGMLAEVFRRVLEFAEFSGVQLAVLIGVEFDETLFDRRSDRVGSQRGPGRWDRRLAGR